MRVLLIVSSVASQAAAELWRHKLRTILTMFGIGWGICALALILATGEGFRQGQRKNWEQLGDRVVMVFPGRTEMQAGGRRAGRDIDFLLSDVEAIREQCPLVETVSFETKRFGVPVESEKNAGKFLTLGIEPEYLKLRNMPVSEGRHLSWSDLDNRSRVCVLGDSVRKQLFEDVPIPQVLSSTVRINGHHYQVVGLMGEKNQNSSYDGWDNDKVLIPVTTMLSDCPPSKEVAVEDHIQLIVYRPTSVEQWEAAEHQVRRTLGRIHSFNPEDEAAAPMWDTIQSAEMFDSIFASLRWFLGTVALVTLTLGGIGVMNTMMTSVTERTAEIGVKKAVGATRGRIMCEFMLEGLIIAIMAGGGGLTLVALLAFAVNSLPMPAFFSGLPIDGAMAFKLAAALGLVAVFSALPPAWKASQMTPVDALRFER